MTYQTRPRRGDVPIVWNSIPLPLVNVRGVPFPKY
jgi:hypothetical protein